MNEPDRANTPENAEDRSPSPGSASGPRPPIPDPVQGAPGLLASASVVAAGGDGASAAPLPVPSASLSFLAHLDSLKEIMNTLALEGREEGILREGTTGIVEIVGADCAIAVVEPINGTTGLRFGWLEGRHMATHEIEVVHRSLKSAVAQVREGKQQRVVLPEGVQVGGDAGEPGSEADGPRPTGMGRDPATAMADPSGGFRPRRFGAAMILDVAPGAGRRGVLILARHDPVAFGREDALLAEILAAQMAIQIDRARKANDARKMSDRLAQEVDEATRGLRERNHELAALNAIAAATGPSLEPDRQVDVALRKAMEITRHVIGVLHLLEDEGGSDVLRMLRGVGDATGLERLRARVLKKGDGAPGRVWEKDAPLVVPDLTADPGPFPVLDPEERDALRRAGCRALICVPVRARSGMIGTLLLAADDSRRYTDAEIGLVQAIGDQVAVVLQNARLISDVMHYSLDLEARLQRRDAQLQRRQAEADLVRSILEAGGGSHEVRLLLEDGLGRLLALMADEPGAPSAGEAEPARGRAQAGMVHLIDPRTRALQLRAQRGLSPEALASVSALPVGRTLIGRAFEGGEPMAAEPCAGAPRDAEDRMDVTGLRILAAVPLRTAGGVHGVLSVAGRTAEALDPGETDLLAGIGRLIGLAVESRRAYQETAAPPRPDVELPPALVSAQKMESVGTLAGGIAHEFNNIIGAILGYATHIKSLASADNPIHRQAVVIEQQAVRAAELTKQLLAFARGGQYAVEKVDLNTILADTASLLKQSIDPRISIETRIEPDLPFVDADAGQMKQAILNVAVNASDAMPEGGRVSFESRVAHLDQRYVQACPGLTPGDYVEVVVADTGAGMPPEIADRAFEPFFTTKPDGRGTGLGLSVVYGIVRNHGGHVTLESTPGLGTTVRIYLPVAARGRRRPTGSPPTPDLEVAGALERMAPEPAAPEPEIEAPVATTAPPLPEVQADPPAEGIAVAPAEAAPEPAPAGKAVETGRPRIMVVDDESAIRDMMRDILESNGYTVVMAVNGVEALDVYRQEWGRIALVLLDMVMPKMGGIETFRRILGMDRSARVILCSGYADNAQAQQAIREGALGFFPKPFTMSELLTRVKRVLGDRAPGR